MTRELSKRDKCAMAQ